MKKTALILIYMLLATTYANAAGYSVNCDNQSGTITFRLTGAGEKPLTVYVQDHDGNIIAIGDTSVSNNAHEAVLAIPGNIIKERYYTAVVEDWEAENDIEKVEYEQRAKEIYIADPNKISDILSDMSSKNEKEIAQCIEKYYKELDIDIQTDYTTSCAAAFVSVRGDKTYSKFSDIKDDYNTAKAAGFFADSPRETLFQRANLYADAMGIEFDEDYEKCSDELWRVFPLIREGLSVDSDVKKTVKEWFDKAQAIALINISDRDEMDSVIKKYGATLGFDVRAYNDLESQSKQMAVSKALHGKKFNSAKEVKTAFYNALKAQTQESKPSSGGGGRDSNASSVPSSATLPYEGIKTPQPDTGNDQDRGFSDITNSHWAYPAISKLTEMGVISGYSDNTVRPDKSVTRAEFVKMLIVAEGKYSPEAECDFNDIDPNAWYSKYIASAVNEGIVKGYDDNTFRPENELTRQDAALMIFRSAKIEDRGIAAEFKDKKSISDYASAAVYALSKAGIINGFENGEFRPLEKITRAQVAQIIYKMRGEE